VDLWRYQRREIIFYPSYAVFDDDDNVMIDASTG